MESITDIDRFLNIDVCNSYGNGTGRGARSGYGSGSGSGFGYGRGAGAGFDNGSGYGYGARTGYGSGSGSGYGYGTGNGCGYGYGYGSSSGAGYGNGSSYGDGYGSGLISFNGFRVNYIDKMATIIKQVKGNLAKGFIINNDLTTENCYVVKSGSLFAHGRTLEEARKALQDKIFNAMDTDEKIDLFLEKFNMTDEYPAKDFYEWHHILTGSCEMGRNAFVKNHGIDLENDKYTVREFIDLTKDDYGENVIKSLEERLSE